MSDSLTAAKAPSRAPTPGTVVTREAKQSAADAFEFVMATDDVDRMGDVVEIAGVDLTAFRSNPIALWQHNPANPIGRWANIRKSAGRLIGRLELAAEGTNRLADDLRRLIEQRILTAVSVGFRVLKWEPLGDEGGLRFLKSELVECSLVSIPANPAALRIRALAALGDSPALPSILGQPGATGSSERTGTGAAITRSAPVGQIAPSQGLRTMDPVPQGTSLPARIVHHQTRLAAIGAELRSLEEAAAEGDGRDFTAEELATIETLTADKATNESQLNACLTLENSIAARAQPAGNGQTVLNPATRRVEPRARVKEKPGFMLAKMATVSVLSHFKKQPIERIVASHYANDDRVAGCMDYMLKSAVAIADSTTPGWAGELVREDIAAFMADIENVSVYAALRTRGRTVDFDGAGRISIPSRTNQGNMAPAWVGEAGVIPVVQGSFAARLLEPTKLASITTFSKELLNNTSGQIEATLRDALRVDAATTLDAALLDATAARPQVRPAGLQVGATVVPSGGPDAAAADLKAALSPIIAAGGGQNIVLIMNPVNVLGLQFATNMLGLPAYPEIAQGRFAGYAFIASNNVPAGTVFVMDASEFASGAGVPNFEISEEATLTMANADGTAPTQAVDAAGAIDVPGQVGPDLGIKVAGNAAAGAGTAGYQAFSMFQMWSVALRMILPVHWMMLRDDMVSVITGVDWGGEPTP